jgi:formylglycine-generating enzyme required for sulfatase activity
MASALSTIAAFSAAFLVFTGLYLSVHQGSDATVQLAQLLHVVLGWAMLTPMGWALFKHWQVRGNNRSGLASLALVIIALGSGLGITIVSGFGYQPSPWLQHVHLWSSAVMTLVVLAHIALAVKQRLAGRWSQRWVIPAIAGTVVVFGLSFAAGAWLQSVRAAPQILGYALPYGEDPYAPSQVKVTDDGFVHPAILANSEACRACHQDIYQQWSESMHRYSATDPHVATGIQWFQRENGVAAGRFCAGCHNPIALISGEIDETVTSAEVGTPPHDEGISCLTCHSTIAIGTEPLGNGSYLLKPPTTPLTLFGSSWIGKMLLRLDIAGHKQRMMKRPLMQEPIFCASCHQQILPEKLTGVRLDERGHQFSEWLASPYSERGSEQYKTCNDCHMPLVTSNDPAAVGGKIHSHRFVGANHAHAVASGHEIQAQKTLKFLQDSLRMEVEIAKNQTRAGHIQVNVRVTNVGAGHNFPSGTTDISEAWIEVIAGDPQQPVFTSGLLDERHYLDPEAHCWKTVYVDKANVPVDLHNLATVRRIAFKRYIAPQQTDVATYTIPVKKRDQVIALRTRLRLRKANQRWNDWLSNFDGSTVEVTDIHSMDTLLDPSSVIVPETNPPPATIPYVRAPKIPGMIFIPAGPALIGTETGDADERPVHIAQVSAFYIDRYPVTNRQYQQHIKANSGTGPVHKLPWADQYNWTGQDYPTGTAEQPAVLISFEEAKAYCIWAGKRLTREVEWEKAARGGCEQFAGQPCEKATPLYPWGNQWSDGTCAALDGKDVPDQVGLCPDRASPYGVQDMVGGVFEWTSTRYGAYNRIFLHPNANEWINTFGDPNHSVRGVPTMQSGPATTAASRAGHADNMRARIGFRCAKNINP